MTASPIATQEKLPQPDPTFKGKIGESYKDSTPSYPQAVKAAVGSPNVLLILLDDVGFGMCSTFGGTRNPMVVHWPKGIKSAGETRTQFHPVIDVVPTILEAAKIAAPKEVNGIAQKPIEGVSMLYSFDDSAAQDTRTTQYFEMFTNRAGSSVPWPLKFDKVRRRILGPIYTR